MPLGVRSIAFTHGYWEAGGPGSEFNFASSTTAAGNSIFYYDRLGVGSSSKPDGIKEVQSTVQVEIAHLLIEHLKSTGSFKRVVGIGHSFGSILTTGVAAKYPGDFNDIILTGFAGGDQVGILVSMASFGATIASPLLSGVNPSSSYFTVGTFSNFQMGVLKFPFFDSRVAQAQFEGRGTATLGEIATLSLPASAPATEFSGRVLVVTGMEDAFFCAGNCAEVVNGVTLPNVVAGLFPATSGFSSYVPPNTGHALNYHFSASSTFAFIQNWLDS
ncbi:hypothetical protein SISNIDRAFT_134000 [Sistotremastrum niveocremeum HHB9708]|uniref:AB hydrolase-1 domain-containing protein n=1 Tax=Sistotremastrum niveocremeum HHB9708 TaxID=1314777 RepID=A0A164ZWE3_9AGAM|nr:hypothetical protein SISNIDRAFT_134000 [Sistotremastrum niveocremeum HHB9708]